MRRVVRLFALARDGVLVWLAGTLVTEWITDLILQFVREALHT